MIRRSALFLTIAAIAGIQLASGAIAVSMMPGWHTTIIPPHPELQILVFVWLWVIPLGYFILEAKNKQFSKKLMIFHLALTLFFFSYTSQIDALYSADSGRHWFTISLGLFITGQVFFLIAFLNKLIRS